MEETSELAVVYTLSSRGGRRDPRSADSRPWGTEHVIKVKKTVVLVVQPS